MAHENTTKRMSRVARAATAEVHASPAGALPTRDFQGNTQVERPTAKIGMGYIPPAHTDTDIYIRSHRRRTSCIWATRLIRRRVSVHRRGHRRSRIGGMVRGVDHVLKLADASTKIVSGHGPLSDRAGLTSYRAYGHRCDRVQKLKTSGRKVRGGRCCEADGGSRCRHGKAS